MSKEQKDDFELMHRKSDQIEVWLMWHKQANVLSIVLQDPREGVDMDFLIPSDEGLEAFYHPYAYAHGLGHMATREDIGLEFLEIPDGA